MDRSDAIHVSVGAALLAIGGGGILALLIYAAGVSRSESWCAPWFLASFGVAGVVTLTGVYMLAALYIPLPLPQTRAAREVSPDLRIDSIDLLGLNAMSVHRTLVVDFRIGLMNHGRGDVTGAVANVLVPVTAMEFTRVDADGAVSSQGTIRQTPESIQNDNAGNPLPSRYWTAHGLVFPGRTASPLDFRAVLSRDTPSFRVKVEIVSADLARPLIAEQDLHPFALLG